MKVFIFAAFAILFAVARGQGPPPLLPDPVTMDFSGRWGKAINGTVYQDCLLMLSRVDANQTIDGSPLSTIYVDRFPAAAVQYQYDALHGCRVVEYAGSYCSTRLMPYSSLYVGTSEVDGVTCNQWNAKLQDGTVLDFWADADSQLPVRLSSTVPSGAVSDIYFSNVIENVNINVFTVPSSWRC